VKSFLGGFLSQGSYGHGKPGKVMEFVNGYFQVWKSHGKKIFKSHMFWKSLGNLLYMCIYAEFLIINSLLKEWRSKYKPVNAP